MLDLLLPPERDGRLCCPRTFHMIWNTWFLAPPVLEIQNCKKKRHCHFFPKQYPNQSNYVRVHPGTKRHHKQSHGNAAVVTMGGFCLILQPSSGSAPQALYHLPGSCWAAGDFELKLQYSVDVWNWPVYLWSSLLRHVVLCFTQALGLFVFQLNNGTVHHSVIFVDLVSSCGTLLHMQ